VVCGLHDSFMSSMAAEHSVSTSSSAASSERLSLVRRLRDLRQSKGPEQSYLSILRRNTYIYYVVEKNY